MTTDGAQVRQVSSFCRVCGSGCGILVDIERVDGVERAVRVTGDPTHPLTAGYTCSKGRALPSVTHSERRLLEPTIRMDGDLVPVTWDRALDDLAARLQTVITESGPAAVGVFLGGGGYMDSAAYAAYKNLPDALGTPAKYSDMSIDVMSKILSSDMVAGIAGMLTRPDYERCRLVIYVGTNPLVSHGHTSMLNNPAVRMREMRARGEVWVLDPRRSETAARADRHLASRPGTDYAVLAFLVREILREGADTAYLDAHAQDVPALAAAVEPYDVEKASAIAGLEHDDLSDLLASVRTAGRLCVETGTGISMGLQANVTQWLSWALMIVTGSLDREGGAWVNPGLHHQLDKLDAPHSPPEGWRFPGPKSRPELLTLAMEYPAAAIADEIESGHLRALINLSGSLMTCLPDTARTAKALARLEVLATVEVMDNATTAASTHVLPAKHQLERADLALATDFAYPTIANQHTPAVLEPPVGVRSFWWILTELGRRLGIDVLPGADPDRDNDEDVLAMLQAKGRPDDGAVRAHGYASVEGPTIGWLQEYADRIGGWRVAPPQLVEQLARIQPVDGLVLIPRRQMHHINSRMMSGRDHPAILVSTEDAVRAGVDSGSMAVLRSAHGSLTGVVEIDPSLRPGAVTVPHGWSGDYNVNHLTSSDDLDPVTGMPRFSGLPVTLNPWTP